MSISPSGTRDRYGFLLHDYPSPFFIDGARWRSISQWIRHNDSSDILPVIVAKFMQNPRLGVYLASTSPKNIDLPDGDLIAKVRDDYTMPAILDDNDKHSTALANLSNIIRDRGYDLASNIPEEEAQGIRVSGKNGDAIIDVYLTTLYPESRLKEVIDANEKLPASRDKPAYFIVGSIDKASLASIMRKISLYANITYYSIAELIAMTNRHELTPDIRVVGSDDPAYKDIVGLILPEISYTDNIVLRYGIEEGSIIEVMDFSPHYRRVV